MRTGAHEDNGGYQATDTAAASQTPNRSENELHAFVPPPETNDNPLSAGKRQQPVHGSSGGVTEVQKAYMSRHEVSFSLGWASYRSKRSIKRVGSANPPRPEKNAGALAKFGAMLSSALAVVRAWFGWHQ